MTPHPAFLLSRFLSPIGDILLVCDRDDRVVALDFHTHVERMHRLLELRHGLGRYTLIDARGPVAAVQSLEAYFGGDLTALDDIVVRSGGTPFEQRVWTALRAIPAGTTATYADIARAVGKPTAYRAVGRANGNNPVGIIVPCHRVIGASGALIGYGGGLERKAWLLAHEGAAREARPHLI